MSFKISLKDTCFHISIHSLGLYLFQKTCRIFSQTYIFHHVRDKIFKFMVVAFLESALHRGILLMPLPIQNSPRSSCHRTLGRRKLLISPGNIFSKSVSPNSRMTEETLIYFAKIPSENMKMTWSISLFIFCIFFQMLWLYSFVNNIYHIVWY